MFSCGGPLFQTGLFCTPGDAFSQQSLRGLNWVAHGGKKIVNSSGFSRFCLVWLGVGLNFCEGRIVLI